jgi:hypothetical protein
LKYYAVSHNIKETLIKRFVKTPGAGTFPEGKDGLGNRMGI